MTLASIKHQHLSAFPADDLAQALAGLGFSWPKPAPFFLQNHATQLFGTILRPIFLFDAHE